MRIVTALLSIFIALSPTEGVACQNLERKPVGVGETAPDFTLEDQNKTKVTLSAARAKSPVVLVFYRGYW